MEKRMLRFIFSIASAMALTSAPPREDPRTVPPFWWISSTTWGFKSIPDTGNSPYPVEIPEGPNHCPDDIVQAGTKTAAGYDARVDMAGIKVDLLPGPRLFQAFFEFYRFAFLPYLGGDVVEINFGFVDIINPVIPPDF
jgi:hypothetical protein